MNRAVFLDRDGVITRMIPDEGHWRAPMTLAEMELLPGVLGALERLRSAGFLLILTTNQPDVSRGRGDRAGVEAIHAHLRQELPLDDIRVCYHDDADACACRKPAPGMLYAAAVERNISLAASYMVGDRWRDVAAGRRAGCTTILVDGGHREPASIEPDLKTADLDRAAEWILTDRQ